MVLHCPKCHMQHIDRPNHWADDEAPCEPPMEGMTAPEDAVARTAALRAYEEAWTNPPHRSHLCHGCGHIWRPADVPTNGVAAVKTTGHADSPLAGAAPGAPAARFDWLMDELEKRLPDPEPFSAMAPEPRYMAALDRLLAATPPAGAAPVEPKLCRACRGLPPMTWKLGEPCDRCGAAPVGEALRERFETAMRAAGCPEHWTFGDDGTGGYHNNATEWAWIAWCAALAPGDGK
jgi:hypothetical protein